MTVRRQKTVLRTSIAAVLIAALVGTSGCASFRKKEAFQDADYFLREKTVETVEFTTNATFCTVAALTPALLDLTIDSVIDLAFSGLFGEREEKEHGDFRQ